MHDFEQGFLSEPFDEVRNAIRGKYMAWRRLLLRVNGRCVAVQHTLNVHTSDPRELLAAALFARTLASTQAGVLLLEHGLLSQSRTMLRAALETLFQLGAIRRKPDVVSALLKSHEADRRTAADRMLQWESPELRKAAQEHISEDELNIFLLSNAAGRNQYKLACDAGMEDWYRTLYFLFSLPAHGAPSDLATHIVMGDGGFIEALRNEPEIQGQSSSWSYAI